MSKSYKPTKSMVETAKRGLKAREDNDGKGGLDTQEAGKQGIGSGVARARDIAAGKSLSLDTVKQMARWYMRHKKNYDADQPDDKGTISHWLWGFPAALGWVRDILRENDVDYELVKQLDELDMSDKTLQKSAELKIAKADKQLGIVFGWGQIAKERTEKGLSDYYDTDNDHFTEEAIVEAWTDFMSDIRVMKALHQGEQVGDVVFSFPMTEEIAKSLGIDASALPYTGMIVGVKPEPGILEKYTSGEWNSFSVGGMIKSFDEE